MVVLSHITHSSCLSRPLSLSPRYFLHPVSLCRSCSHNVCVLQNKWSMSIWKSVSSIYPFRVNFQNAITSCVIILSSIKFRAGIPLFMLSLHNSFMLFACLASTALLFSLLIVYSRSGVFVWVVVVVWICRFFALSWLVGLKLGLLDFSTLYRQLMGLPISLNIYCQFHNS